MAFIRISHSVSYVRQFDFLNDQGGKATISRREALPASANFPISFKRVLTAVGTLDNYTPEYSGHNFDDEITLTNTRITFKYYQHYYIAIGV